MQVHSYTHVLCVFPRNISGALALSSTPRFGSREPVSREPRTPRMTEGTEGNGSTDSNGASTPEGNGATDPNGLHAEGNGSTDPNGDRGERGPPTPTASRSEVSAPGERCHRNLVSMLNGNLLSQY